MAKPKDGGLNKYFRLFDVFSLFDVSVYTFKRRKRHSASFLNSHNLPKNKFFDKLEVETKCANVKSAHNFFVVSRLFLFFFAVSDCNSSDLTAEGFGQSVNKFNNTGIFVRCGVDLNIGLQLFNKLRRAFKAFS